jgi:hypothetical protein
MDLDTDAKFAQIVQNVSVALASIIAGIWALLRLRRERTHEAALKIEILSTPVDPGARYTAIEVILTNQGHVKLQANEAIKPGPVYADRLETISFSCTLAVKRIADHAEGKSFCIDWFDSDLFSLAIPEINLLAEYQNPERNERVEFWMEPGESYRVGSVLRLPPGPYLAKVTFVGSNSSEDFWTQVTHFSVTPK